MYLVSRKNLFMRKMAIIKLFCGRVPPESVRKAEEAGDFDPLQQWVSDHLKPAFEYATALSVIEAADAIAASQIENGMEKLNVPDGDVANLSPKTLEAIGLGIEDVKAGRVSSHRPCVMCDGSGRIREDIGSNVQDPDYRDCGYCDGKGSYEG